MKKNMFVLIAALCAVNGALAIDFKNLSDATIAVKKEGRLNRFHTIKPKIGKESFPFGLGDVLFVKSFPSMTVKKYKLTEARSYIPNIAQASFKDDMVILSGKGNVSETAEMFLQSSGYVVRRSSQYPGWVFISIPGETVYSAK